MNKYQKFYEKIVGYEPYQEIRVRVGDNWHSYYPRNFEETKTILTKFGKKYNCYVGVNPRKSKGQSGDDVAYRGVMVFDIERLDDKPPLSDEKYIEDLNNGINIVRKLVSKFVGGDVSCVVRSGRGIHLYYKLIKVNTDYQAEYIIFYNHITRLINKELEPLNLKADPPVKDLPRVFGCPGTQNTKYDEFSAFRSIMSYEDNVSNIQKQLDKAREKYKNKSMTIKKRRRTLDFIRKSPEYQIFKHKPLKGTGINNYLRLALKLLMRECDLTREETEIISYELKEMGFPRKDMFMGNAYPELRYSKALIQKWCWNNWEWCVDVKFKFPYFKVDTIDSTRIEYNNVDIPPFHYDKQVRSYEDFMSFIRKYNQQTYDKDRGIFYFKGMKHHLENNCSWKFWEFVENYGDNLLFMYRNYIVSPKDEIEDEFLEL